jgi:ankyrin repeat domain-containing protein 50
MSQKMAVPHSICCKTGPGANPVPFAVSVRRRPSEQNLSHVIQSDTSTVVVLSPIMSDPLSIVAAAAGLIALSIEVSKGLIAFYSASKSQDGSVARTLRKLDMLLSTLEELDQSLQHRNPKANEEAQNQNVAESIQNCREIVAELQSELDKFSNSSEKGYQAASKRMGRKLTYPFKQSTLQKLDEDISDFLDNLQAALGVLHLKRVDSIQDDTADLKILVRLLRESQISDTIRKWLKAPDATLDHNEACKRRHPRTGLWLVTGPAFEKWLEEDGSFLWINGRPGCGKTVLSSTAIQYSLRHRRSDPRIGIAFYYFSFSDDAKQDVSGLLRAVLLQLSNQVGDGDADISSLYDKHKDAQPPVPALMSTLRRVIAKFQNVYIVVDALDESPRGEKRDAVLETLSEVRGWLMRGLHILVTSRDELDIRENLRLQINEEVRMDKKAVDQDIKDYIVQRLQKDGRFKKFAKYHAVIEKTLIERADGM